MLISRCLESAWRVNEPAKDAAKQLNHLESISAQGTLRTLQMTCRSTENPPGNVEGQFPLHSGRTRIQSSVCGWVGVWFCPDFKRIDIGERIENGEIRRMSPVNNEKET